MIPGVTSMENVVLKNIVKVHDILFAGDDSWKASPNLLLHSNPCMED